MGPKNSLIRNTLALFVPNAVNPFLSFLLVLAISRYLGVEGLGQYSLILSFSLIFTTIASLGLGNLLVRQVTRSPKDVHVLFLNSVAFGIVSSILAVIGMNLFMQVMRYDKEVTLAALVCSFSLIPDTAMRFMESMFRALERSEYLTACYMAENILRVAVCVYLVLSGYGIVSIFIAIFFTRLLAFFLMLFFYVRLNGMPRWTFSAEVWQMLLRETPTFIAIAIFSTVHMNIASVMLSKLKSIEAVGIYSAAGRIVGFCETLPMAFALAVLPFLTKKSSSGLADLKESSIDSLRYVFLAVLPIVAGTFILSDDIIELIYGQKFMSAGPVLRFQALTSIPYSIVLVLAQLLTATDHQKVDLGINIAAVAISLILNFLLIPRFGEMGAVFAVLFTIIILNHVQYLYIRKLLFTIPFWEIMKKPLLATVGMSIVTYVLKGCNIFINISASGLLYVLLLILFQAFTKDEIRDLKKVFRIGYSKEEQ